VFLIYSLLMTVLFFAEPLLMNGRLFKIYYCYMRILLVKKSMAKKQLYFFSYNTPQDRRSRITSLFGTTTSAQFEKYLGLPSIIGRTKKKAFSEVNDRIWKRLQGWKEKLLSQVGREVLIKAVIQAIPKYAMSVFNFPAGLCADICSMANRFCWGQRGGNRKIHWLRKEKLVIPKGGDAWVSSPTTHRILSPCCVLDPNATVDSLIVSETMSWNKPLLNRVFWPRDISLILEIPLSLRKPPNKLIWSGTKNGQFTVRSVHLLLAQQ
jgi:hypothetical protein